MQFPPPTVTDDELAALEAQVQSGLERRSLAGLNVLGFGEIGVAIGYPETEPTAVVKRVPAVKDRSEIESWFTYLEDYEVLVGEHVEVAPTAKRVIASGDGRWVGYLIQPRYPATVLVENILAAEEPTEDHPIVVAVRDVALAAIEDGRAAIDTQFSNFVWIDGALTTIDCGSPFLYKPDGSPDYRVGAYSDAMPAALRPVVVKLATKITAEVGTPAGNLELAALSIVRIDQQRWLESVLATFNQRLDDPIDTATVIARFDKLHGEMQQIKRLGKLQRAWLEKVRRRRYEFFITDSFTGEVL